MTRVIRTILTSAFVVAASAAGVAQGTAAQATGPFPPQAPSASKPAVFRGGTWYLRATTLPGKVSVSSFQYGKAGDIPVMGDWNGDGTKTVGVVRGRVWYIRNSNSAGPSSRVFSFGRPGDVPVAGDWDGNGTDTPAVVRCTASECSRRTWYARNTLATGPATSVLDFGAGGVAVVADWDNIGGDTPGLFNMNTGVWSYTNSWLTSGQTRFKFGTRDDKPVVGDWGIDNQTSVGVVRRGTWIFGRGIKGGPGVWSIPFGRPTDTFLVWQ